MEIPSGKDCPFRLHVTQLTQFDDVPDKWLFNLSEKDVRTLITVAQTALNYNKYRRQTMQVHARSRKMALIKRLIRRVNRITDDRNKWRARAKEAEPKAHQFILQQKKKTL